MGMDADQHGTVSRLVSESMSSAGPSVDVALRAHLDVIRAHSLAARERYADLLERLGR